MKEYSKFWKKVDNLKKLENKHLIPREFRKYMKVSSQILEFLKKYEELIQEKPSLDAGIEKWKEWLKKLQKFTNELKEFYPYPVVKEGDEIGDTIKELEGRCLTCVEKIREDAIKNYKWGLVKLVDDFSTPDFFWVTSLPKTGREIYYVLQLVYPEKVFSGDISKILEKPFGTVRHWLERIPKDDEYYFSVKIFVEASRYLEIPEKVIHSIPIKPITVTRCEKEFKKGRGGVTRGYTYRLTKPLVFDPEKYEPCKKIVKWILKKFKKYTVTVNLSKDEMITQKHENRFKKLKLSGKYRIPDFEIISQQLNMSKIEIAAIILGLCILGGDEGYIGFENIRDKYSKIVYIPIPWSKEAIKQWFDENYLSKSKWKKIKR